ncbi:MAG: hypothetical protein IOC63_07210 [Methylobacterium sp.]|nr:hypothetical protein [Methylobacterium sp.]
MFGWLKSLLGNGGTGGAGAIAPTFAADFDQEESEIVPNATEVEFVKSTVAQLEVLGLKINAGAEFDSTAYTASILRIFENSIGFHDVDETQNRFKMFSPYPELNVLWGMAELSKYYPFVNAITIGDHCYDVIEEEQFYELISQIFTITGSDWPLSEIDIVNFMLVRPGNMARSTLYISSENRKAEIQFRHWKDFDESIFGSLNRNCPPGVKSRFGYSGDGGSICILWLPPEQIQAVSKFVGLEFIVPTGEENS